MPASGMSIYCDPDDYQLQVRIAKLDLVFAHGGDFNARLTQVELPHLNLFHSRESLPRIAFVSLPVDWVFVAFPISPDPPPIWGGLQLTSGDIVVHGRGERMHQRTSAAGGWGFITITPADLAVYGKTLAGLDLVPARAGRILQSPLPVKAELFRLHAQACHL